jgi:hypothetical protein
MKNRTAMGDPPVRHSPTAVAPPTAQVMMVRPGQATKVYPHEGEVAQYTNQGHVVMVRPGFKVYPEGEYHQYGNQGQVAMVRPPTTQMYPEGQYHQ